MQPFMSAWESGVCNCVYTIPIYSWTTSLRFVGNGRVLNWISMQLQIAIVSKQTMSHTSFVVVLWSNMLGAFYWRQDSLPWSGSSFPSQTSGEWAQTGQAKQCCMF